MQIGFATLDYIVFASYFFILALLSLVLSRKKITTTKEYFVGSNSLPTFAVAISVLATSQSAATFLGAPEYSYKLDLTLIGFYISALLAVFFVAKILVPRFYAIKAVTVYELLESRYGSLASKQAGFMFLVGRLFASGARLYIASLAVSMIMFYDVTLAHITLSITILIFGALVFTYFGGVKSVIYSDILQAVTYIGAGLAVVFYIYTSLDMSTSQIINLLSDKDKLNFIDLSFSFTSDGKFNIFGLLSGWLLLNIAAFGLDQDLTQRVLSCKDEKEAKYSLYLSTLLTIPVVMLFLIIGLLLYLFYEQHQITQSFKGESITIFMYYILNEMPSGLKGLVTVGAIAAALSSTNSVLGAMSSVAIEDLYKPYKLQKDSSVDAMHFVHSARVVVFVFAILLSLMAILSFLVHQASDIPLISFALGVMAFAYSGLLGVFISAIFTSRGDSSLVPFALICGFLSVLCMQSYTFGLDIGFSWQILIGTLISFLIMQSGNSSR